MNIDRLPQFFGLHPLLGRSVQRRRVMEDDSDGPNSTQYSFVFPIREIAQ